MEQVIKLGIKNVTFAGSSPALLPEYS